jgi:serine/threonine protein phosphatase PrpC
MTAVPTILAAAVTDVGKVRKNNEDAHWVDVDAGLAIVCDGMGGHQAGEVASQLAVSMVREQWRSAAVEQARIAAVRTNTPAARHALVRALRDAVLAANEAIVARSESEHGEEGMGTTFLGVCFLSGEAMLCHAGDSRAYLVRDGAATLLTEDHTLLARLADAGVETGPDANRWKGVVTNALGVGEPTWVATAALRLADGDRLLLCSDGVSEYFTDGDIATVLTKIPSPAKAARKLIDLALDRGGHDNATAVVIKVVEVGVAPDLRAADEAALAKCPLLADLGVPRRLRVLRMATEHVIDDNEPLPPRFLGDRVAWIILAGQVHRGGARHKPGGLLYPECLVAGGDGAHATEWIARGPVRALAIRADDLAELANDEPDVGEKVYASLAAFVGTTVR